MAQVDDALANFSRALIPTNKFIQKGKKLAEKIFEALKVKSKFSIGRYHYGGAAGRQSDITCPDLQLTVFINNMDEGLFKDVLVDFASAISASVSVGINEDQISVGNESVQFKIPDKGLGREENAGFYVILQPAVNFVPVGNVNLQPIHLQRNEVIKMIERDHTKKHFYKSSLVESHLDFMGQQIPHVNDLVRLAKFWYKSISLGEYVLDGLTIVELTAVAAAKLRKSSLHDAFMTFITYMSRLDHLRVSFFTEGNVLDVFQSSANTNESSIPPRTLKKLLGMKLSTMKRFIVGPSDQFNDILSPLSGAVIFKLMEFARVTLDGLKVPRVHSSDRGEPFLMLSSYFRPFPRNLINADPALPLNSASLDYLCGGLTEKRSLKPLNPIVTVRNRNVFRSSKKQRAQALQNLWDAHTQFISTTVNAAAFSGRRQTLDEIVDSVCQMIDEDIRGTCHQKWKSNETKTHDEFDITFYVPINTVDGLGSVAVSVRLDYHGRAGNCFKQ